MKRYIALLSWTLAVIVVALGAGLTPARAQQPAKVPTVGFLGATERQEFRQGLGDLGYVEGRNIIVEYRSSEGRADRLPGLAAELVELKVDIIIARGLPVALAVKKTTTTIPVVFAVVVDPVAVGLVADSARPGGNLTGFTSFDPQQARKQLELLKDVISGLTRVAILGDQDIPDALFRENEAHARAIGLQPQLLKLQGPTPDLQRTFEAARRERAEALLVLSHPVAHRNRKAIAELAVTHRLPALFPPNFVDDDWRGLMAYGTSLTEAARRIPAYVDKILKGAKPGDLPVEAVTRGALLINLKMSREIGVTIPPDVLKRADQVIQ